MGEKKQSVKAKKEDGYPEHKIIYPERPPNRRTLWIAGIVLAIAAAWGLVQYGRIAHDQGREQERSEIEQERLLASTILSGTVTLIRRQLFMMRVVGADDAQREIEVRTPFGTKFYLLTADPESTRVEIGQLEIEPGSFVTVKSKTPIGTKSTINAVEVVKVN